MFQTQQRWSCKCAFQIKTINQRLQTKRPSNQKSNVCNASWKLLAERPFHSTSGLWAWYTFSICVRGSKAVCKSIINAAAATEEPAVLLHVDENVTIKVSCLYLCLIFNLSIVWCFYSGRKYSVTNPHRSMEWFWFWFWSDESRETQAAAVDDRHAAARPASGPVGYLPALTEVTWWLTPAGEIDMFVVRLCWIVVICWTVSVRSAAARSSGSRQLDSFFMRLETRAALIHDGCKSASVSRGRITERPHVFASWRLTSAMIPSPFIQPQSHTWSCGNIFVVLFQSDRMKWFDLDIFKCLLQPVNLLRFHLKLFFIISSFSIPDFLILKDVINTLVGRLSSCTDFRRAHANTLSSAATLRTLT